MLLSNVNRNGNSTVGLLNVFAITGGKRDPFYYHFPQHALKKAFLILRKAKWQLVLKRSLLLFWHEIGKNEPDQNKTFTLMTCLS